MRQQPKKKEWSEGQSTSAGRSPRRKQLLCQTMSVWSSVSMDLQDGRDDQSRPQGWSRNQNKIFPGMERALGYLQLGASRSAENLVPWSVTSRECISNITWASQSLQWTIWLRAVRRGSDPTGLLEGPSTLTLKRSASHVPGTVRVHQNAQPVSVSGSRQTWWHPQTQESWNWVKCSLTLKYGQRAGGNSIIYRTVE